MAIHRSGVNWRNLIRDLAEMYPFGVSEVILVELIANSLDAKATRISIDYKPSRNTLVVTDNGKGMGKSQFDEYHDFAAGLKTRGTGIGFAGVGAKISFNIANQVITETKSDSFSSGSNWFLKSENNLLWEDIKPGHLSNTGTRVKIIFKNSAKVTYSTTTEIVNLLKRHYLPLLDSEFLDLFDRLKYYSKGLKFVVNGQIVNTLDISKEFKLGKIRKFFPKTAGKLFGYGVLGLAESEYPLGPDISGVLLSTWGKVIKSDLFNQFPGSAGPQLFGLVEIPRLVEFLTTSKTDFIRKRGTYRKFESLYNPIRQEFKDWLRELGVEETEAYDLSEARKIETELRKIIDEVPELSDFFGFRTRKKVLTSKEGGEVEAMLKDGIEPTFPNGEGEGGGGPGVPDEGEQPGEALVRDQERGAKPAEPISRTAKRGPKVNFASRPDREDMAWIEGNNITINSSHPSYLRTEKNSLARRLYDLFAIANSIQKFIANTGEQIDLSFIDRMMAAWGKK